MAPYDPIYGSDIISGGSGGGIGVCASYPMSSGATVNVGYGSGDTIYWESGSSTTWIPYPGYQETKKENRQMKFKIGDKVRSCFYLTRGQVGQVVDYEDDNYVVCGFSHGTQARGYYGNYYAYSENNLELIKEEKMSGQLSGNALSRLAKSLFNGRVKKFIEVGFLTKDLEVTEKFTRSAMAIVMEDLLAHKEGDAELTVSEVGRRLEVQADEELAEAKEEKNCCK